MLDQDRTQGSAWRKHPLVRGYRLWFYGQYVGALAFTLVHRQLAVVGLKCSRSPAMTSVCVPDRYTMTVRTSTAKGAL